LSEGKNTINTKAAGEVYGTRRAKTEEYTLVDIHKKGGARWELSSLINLSRYVGFFL